VESVPDWCLRPKLRGWAYSVLDSGEKDRLLAPGRWFSGNHFWFRSRGLTRQRRFPEVWNPEPQFMLQMVEDGFEGVAGPDAACGHRVQLDLLRYDVVRNRAVQVGRSLAAARLLPYKSKIKQARLMKERPVEGRLYCVASVCGWAGAYVASWLDPVQARRIERRLQALERISTYREYLRIIGENRDYALFRDRRI
jgi:hypothetical protein